MADMNVNLLKVLENLPGPQHKIAGQQALEFTEGSDGKMHMKDSDAHTRLDAIEAALNGTLNAQLTGSSVALKTVSFSNDAIIPAGGSDSFVLSTTPGTIGEIVYSSIHAPAIAGSTGEHRVTIGHSDASGENRILDITGQGTLAITLINGWNKGSSTSVAPSDEKTRMALFSDIWINDDPQGDLVILYINSTDVDVPANSLDFAFKVLETKVTV